MESPKVRGLEQRAELHTATGSTYRVAEDEAGQWWMRATNVPNPRSRPLDPDRWWMIDEPWPWPPQLGRSIRLRAPARLARDDPRRIPGGGKVTSPVRAIRIRP